ncbi:MAG: cytochrome c [Bacteroidetes bacterium]|nr:cytochrome c [Bacteroidota bacterium]
MKKIILTVITTLVIIVAIFTAYMYSGMYDVSQLTPHNALTKWMIRTTLHNSINARLKDIQVSPMNDTANFVDGFGHYNEMCVSCHGAPGIDPGEMAKGLYPKPPKFYKSDDMPDPDESFWIIKNGIKMTSMPAYGPTHNDKAIWAMTDFLLNKMNKMSPEEYQAWIKKYSEQEEKGETKGTEEQEKGDDD